MSKALKAEDVLDQWSQPNNTNTLFAEEQDGDRLRKAFALWKTDSTEAFQRFLRFAEEGSIYSMIQISFAYLRGTGTQVNKVEAENWLLRAYSLGSDQAMVTLANEYRKQKRYSNAEEILRESAQREYSPALYILGFVYLDTFRFEDAKNAFIKATELGHQWARATLWQQGIRGIFGKSFIFHSFRFVIPMLSGIVKNLNEAESETKRGLFKQDLNFNQVTLELAADEDSQNNHQR